MLPSILNTYRERYLAVASRRPNKWYIEGEAPVQPSVGVGRRSRAGTAAPPVKYTITVLGQDDPEAVLTFIADDGAVAVQTVLTDGPSFKSW